MPDPPITLETTHSEAIQDIAAALSRAQGMVQLAHKDSANPFFGSRYADLASIWDACRDPLSKNGLAVVQIPTVVACESFLETILVHSSGQWFRSLYPIKPVKDDPQGVGSAITYARRYALAAMVGVAPVETDDDGNRASGHLEKATPKTSPPPGRTNPPAEKSTPPAPAGRPNAPAPKPALHGDAGTWEDILVRMELSKSKKSHVLTTKAGLRFGVKGTEAVKQVEAAIKDSGTYSITWERTEFKKISYYWAAAIEKVYPVSPPPDSEKRKAEESSSEETFNQLFGPQSSAPPTTGKPATGARHSAGEPVTVGGRTFGNFTILEMGEVTLGGIQCVLIRCKGGHAFYTPDKKLIDQAVKCFNAKTGAALVALKTEFGWRIEALQPIETRVMRE